MAIYGIDVSKDSLEIFSETEQGAFKKKISNKLKPIEHFLSSLNPESTLCLEDGGIYCQLISNLALQFDVKVA